MGYTVVNGKMTVVRKVKNVHSRKETEYAGFMTHLHLLLHMVALDIEALVVP